MPSLRLIIAWVLMAALPLQGMAAAAMLTCGQAVHAKASQQVSHDHASSHADSAAQAPAQHAHDHANTASHASHASHADDGTRSAGAADADGAAAGGHGCPVCTLCCHLVALSEPAMPSLGTVPPFTHPSLGDVRVNTRTALAPDKPPRA